MKEHLWIILIAVVVFTATLFGERYNLLEFVELKTLDKRHSYISGELYPSDEVILVAIDSKSQAMLDSLPWPHDFYLLLHKALETAGPKAIGMMIWFNREWETGEVELPEENNLFIIRPYSTPPVISRDQIPVVTSWYHIPIRFQRAKGKSYSHMVLTPEDGIYRSAQMIVYDEETDEERYPIELMMVNQLRTGDHERIRSGRSFWYERYVEIGDGTRVPVDSGGRFYITYLPPDKRIRTVSFVDVLEMYQDGNTGQLRELFSGKVVLVGETEGAYRVPTPVGEMTALEIRANLVNDLITNEFTFRLSSTVNTIYLAFLLFLSVFVVFLMERHESRVSLVAIMYFVLLLLHLAFCFSLFQNWGIWLNMVTPGMFIMLNGVSSTLFLSYISLKRTQKQLVQSEKEAAFGVMSAQVRHEIRNILNSIRAPAEMVKNNFQKGDPLGLKEKTENLIAEMDAIIGRVMQLNDMIENELSFFREASLKKQPVAIDDVIRSAIEICADEIKKSNIDLFIEIDPSLPLVYADNDKLRIAIINLVRNSCQAMTGGGSLFISAQYYAEGGRSYVQIVIKDTGSGMSRETMKRMFEPFYTTKPRGLGLGLANVQNIVKLHQGQIKAESKEGIGTTITILLPLGIDEEES